MVLVMKLSDNIQYMKGIGEVRAKMFRRLGINTLEDLIFHFPRTYEDRSQIKSISELMDNEIVCVCGSLVQDVKSYRSKNRVSVTQGFVSDGTAIMRVTWFNAPYISATLKGAAEFTFYGKAVYKGQYFEMVNPVIEVNALANKMTGRILSVYPATNGLSQNNIRIAVEKALELIDESFPETLPDEIIAQENLMPLWKSLKAIHLPKDLNEFEAARHRLAFEELFIMQAGIIMMRGERYKYSATPIENVKCIAEFAKALPFDLTRAQKRVINEICLDLKQAIPMNRLVQGDVGSGKTMVAAAAIYATVNAGFQAALMAPTEILAVQHYKNLKPLFEKFGFKTVFLSGSMSAKERRQSLADIENGSAKIVIGTHALISDRVSFKNLTLVVTDEQHRFGVRQRTLLTEKGTNAHTLVMTATPIPRTLSLILYGDLDISTIDELPPGRKPIETYGLKKKDRERANQFVIKNIKEGRQIYIVCPLIEESETLSAKSATEYAEKLKKGVFSDFSIDVIHGKLKPAERQKIMTRFANREIDILVCTTVIEVGVDIANATVMIVENAERFGLSQLHQLRGRIGRGSYQSYCLLFCEGGDIAKERIKIMCETNDGFKISEKDLELRGPGEFLGVRQHGLPELHIANLSTDMELLKKAKDVANELLIKDPLLERAENKALLKKILLSFSEVSDKHLLN